MGVEAVRAETAGVDFTHRPVLGSLTPLRFFAALWVVFFHFGRGWTEEVAPWLGSVRLLGYTGVTFFFVLSGFILAYNYGDRPGRWRDYAVARFARVYPIYLVGMGLSFPMFADLMARFGGVSPGAIFIRLGLMQAWFPAAVDQWNVASWSLSAELFFYLVFPLLLLRLQPHCQRGLRTLLLLAAVAALVPSFVFMNTGGVVGHVGTALLGHNVLKFNPLLRLPDFGFGVILGLFFLREKAVVGSGPWIPSRVALGLGFGVSALLVAFNPWIAWAYLHNGLFVVPFGLIVYGMAWNPWKPARAMTLLGEGSYALYMIHMPFWFWATPLRAWLGSSDRWFFPVVVALMVLVSLGLFFAVEQPMRRWLRRAI